MKRPNLDYDGPRRDAREGTQFSRSLPRRLAYRAGAPLRNMEFVAEAPLGVVGTNLVVPQSILSDGATLQGATGSLDVKYTGTDIIRARDLAVIQTSFRLEVDFNPNIGLICWITN